LRAVVPGLWLSQVDCEPDREPDGMPASGRLSSVLAGGSDQDVVPVSVTLREVRKVFPAGGASVTAVDGVDLDVRDGEFFAMLGPSGSGKTTVLRMIAGFEQPTSGQILLGGTDVSRLAPFQRDVNTVFQDYALFPHLSVQENVAYGLKVKGVGRSERRARSAAALATVRLDGYGPRRPAQLSGGERQRVALARALVNRPKVLLLDEPLGALDLRLREQMQVELKAIQREVGITFLFVTHDQGEAMTMSDRIAVFNRGRIEQVGSPPEIYERPATGFVAGFVGTANLLSGPAAQAVLGSPATASIRPERIRLAAADTALAADVTVEGILADAAYVGPETRYTVNLDAGVRLVVTRPNTGAGPDGSEPKPGDRVLLGWQREHVSHIPDGTSQSPAGPTPTDS
jgi:putative spermidine/putrescine transport system ATP-binding protein